jgi:hypothetical protein
MITGMGNTPTPIVNILFNGRIQKMAENNEAIAGEHEKGYGCAPTLLILSGALIAIVAVSLLIKALLL